MTEISQYQPIGDAASTLREIIPALTHGEALDVLRAALRAPAEAGAYIVRRNSSDTHWLVQVRTEPLSDGDAARRCGVTVDELLTLRAQDRLDYPHDEPCPVCQRRAWGNDEQDGRYTCGGCGVSW